MDKLSKEYFNLLNDKTNIEWDINYTTRKINEIRSELNEYTELLKKHELKYQETIKNIKKFKLIKE